MPSKKSLLVVSYNFSQGGLQRSLQTIGHLAQCVLGLHGGDRKSEKAKDQDRNPTLIGRGSDYDIARLERDPPDLAPRASERALRQRRRHRSRLQEETDEGRSNRCPTLRLRRRSID
jgi:hypothetical protein